MTHRTDVYRGTCIDGPKCGQFVENASINFWVYVNESYEMAKPYVKYIRYSWSYSLEQWCLVY